MFFSTLYLPLHPHLICFTGGNESVSGISYGAAGSGGRIAISCQDICNYVGHIYAIGGYGKYYGGPGTGTPNL